MCRLTLTLLVLGLFLSVLTGCGSLVPMPKMSPDPPPPDLYCAGAYLAPGALAEFPTTVRVRLWVLRRALPIENAIIDPDGDGEAATTSVQVHQLGVLGPKDGGIYYYFDYEWNGPDGTRATVWINTRVGTSVDDQELRLNQLGPWPY